MRDYEELVGRLRDSADWADHFAVLMGRDSDVSSEIKREAADAIEELQADKTALNGTVTNLLEQIKDLGEPRWIPVTGRLPLYGQDVLATRVFGDGEKCQEILMAHVAVWNEETGEKWWNATNITHWMPLPEPPKEEK